MIYIISVLLSDSEYFIEKKFGLSTRVWVSVLGGPKFLSRGQTLGAKSAKKCYQSHCWITPNSKANDKSYNVSTNHIVGFLHLSNRPAKCEDPLRLVGFPLWPPFVILTKYFFILVYYNEIVLYHPTEVMNFAYIS